MPVLFGPNYKKFNEAKDLIAVGGSISIANYQELNLAIKHFNIFDRTISTDYIRNQSGATEIILESL